MGAIRFLVPRPEWFAVDATERAYIAGIDEIPWRSRIQRTDEGIVVQRSETESGNFWIPALIAGHGERMLSTATLKERPQPYHLHVELARGTLNRLRNQIALWQSAEVPLPSDLVNALTTAHQHLSWCVTHQTDAPAAADRAALSIAASLQAIELFSKWTSRQLIASRKQQGRINTLWGVNLGDTNPAEPMPSGMSGVFNTAVVPFNWQAIEAREGKPDWTTSDQQIEWCRAQGLKICGGPLLQIDKWSLPDWMYLWGENDEESFRSCVAEHIREVVDRYRGKVQLWQCAAKLNTGNDFDQGEETRLRLAVLAIECIRRADPRTPIVITMDQPWGAFMSHQDCELSPLHFADALVRADLGLAGLALDMNLGYAAPGSEVRDLLDFSRQIDRWALLGLPLLINLTIPSSGQPDPQARLRARPLSYVAGALSQTSQREWYEDLVSILLTKPMVQGMICNQLLDSRGHVFAHGGLFDERGQVKPVVGMLQSIRKQHLA